MSRNMNEELVNACRDGNLPEVRRLLTAAGADVNANMFGGRPLIFAAADGHVEVVRCLLDNGANIDETDHLSWTAIYYAAQHGHTTLVDLLAFRGANINQKSNIGLTPLMASSKRVQIIETLIVFGAEIDAVNKFAQTALLNAILRRHIDVVRLLLSLNADATKIDIDSKNALQLAESDDELKQLLLQHEKKSDEQRKRIAKETLISIRARLAIRLMRHAQPEIIGICLAFAPLELPPYVLLWIVDWLPSYDKLSHHKKIELITSVRDSIWKLKRRE